MYNKLLVDKDILIIDAINIINDTNCKILIVVTDKNKLLAVVTEGDIRRFILKNGDLYECISNIMNENPIFIYDNQKDKIKSLMQDNNIEAIPILNCNNQVIDIAFWSQHFSIKYTCFEDIHLPVVVMAGGKGQRLFPYTKILPKPLIPIGDTPIVERIINQYNLYNCTEFYLTVNYKKDMIKAYFNSLEKSYNVNYIEEEDFLGTAGSLFLLKDKINSTFMVNNCDVLIDANYTDILKYHYDNNNRITVITSLKNFSIPYGVVELSDNGEIVKTKEKPEYNFLVNTGMYVLQPEVLNDIPENTFFHITDLIDLYIQKGEKVGTYPITQNAWYDMGELKEMESMIERLGL